MSQPPGYGSHDPAGINPNTGLPYSPGEVSGPDGTRAYPQQDVPGGQYGSPQSPAYGAQPGYGSPQAPGYGDASGYGNQSPYGGQPSYGDQGGYGQAPGYGDQGPSPYGQSPHGAEAAGAPAYAPAGDQFAPMGGAYGAAPAGESDKSFVVTWLLGWLLGGLGADRFYLGKIGTAIVKLITAGGFGIWALIDVFRTLFGATRDQQGRPLAGYEQNKKMARLVFFIVWGLSVIVSIVMAIVLAATGIFTAVSSGSGGTGGSSSTSAPQDPAADPGSDSDGQGAAAGTAAEWAETNFGTFETVEQSGSGDGQVEFPADAQGAVITFDYEPSESFDYGMLESVGADNQTTSDIYFSSDFGTPSTSTTAWTATTASDPIAALNVDGEGDWTVTIEPISALETLPASGEGNGAYLYEGPGGTHTISTDGDMGMFVTQYGRTDYAEVAPTVVVSESTTAWSGTGELEPGPGLVTIMTDGAWEIAPQ
ncbi:TM2 domain-containing protein [Brevibacterium album]|uniref:TM2 domain-containing protein n=1 Tax=Brevibacterium album TaxID=417948 RepID=UPI0009FFB08F|nr:TM2 domain-containing protein [Brevibacterium album]